MKKNYITPRTEVMTVETEQMIAASPVPGSIEFDGDSGSAIFGDGHATGDAYSKGHGTGLWDEDEE